MNLATIGGILDQQPFVFAKSYPWVPHYWITAKEWCGVPSILDACHFISVEGTQMLWGKSNPTVRRYIDFKGWRYWHMDYDAFFWLYHSQNPPTPEAMEEWDCKCYLINRQKLHISKAQPLTADLKMPKRFEDFTQPMRRGPKAKDQAEPPVQMDLLLK